jgi:hypothetical protein
MNTKTISISLRKNSNSKFTSFLNFRSATVDELDLKTKPHVELTRNGDRYKVRFLSEQTARSRKILFKDRNAYVGFSPDVFKLEHEEAVSPFPIDAEFVNGALEFDFDQEEFLKPRASSLTSTKKVSTTEEKVAQGFKPDSAWGIKVQAEMDNRIAKQIRWSMKQKFEIEEFTMTQTTNDAPISYANVVRGYLTVNQKVVK